MSTASSRFHVSRGGTRRTREIGIRLVLGVEQRSLRRMFVRHAFILSGIGVVVGLGVAASLTRLMSSMLFRVSPLNGVTYGAVSIVLLTAALMASDVPARRAALLNPVDALRAELSNADYDWNRRAARPLRTATGRVCG